MLYTIDITASLIGVIYHSKEQENYVISTLVDTGHTVFTL
jgi:hypothetical protein